MTNEDPDWAEFQQFQAWKRMKATALVPAAPGSITFRGLFKFYEPIASRRDSWQNTGRCHWLHLLPFWGDIPADEASYDQADDYQALRLSQPIWIPNGKGGHKPGKTLTSPRTINHELDQLRTLINFGIARGKVTRNNLKGHPPLEVTRDRKFPVTYPDFLRILHYVPQVSRLMLILAYETGMRCKEFRELEKVEVKLDHKLKDEAGNTVTVNIIDLPGGKRTKNRKARQILLSADAVAILQAAPQIVPSKYWFPNPRKTHGRAMPKSTFGYHFRTARELAGVKGPNDQEYWIHNLRKSYGTNNAAKGMPLYMLMDQMGHTDHKIHMEYTKLTPAHLLGVLPFLEPDHRQGPHAAKTEEKKPSEFLRLVVGDKPAR